MEITYSTCRDDPRGEDYDVIDEDEGCEIVDNSVKTLITKMQNFTRKHPNAIICDEYEELTLCAVNDDGSKTFMFVNPYRKR